MRTLLNAHSITIKLEPIIVFASCHMVQGRSAMHHADGDVGVGVGPNSADATRAKDPRKFCEKF